MGIDDERAITGRSTPVKLSVNILSKFCSFLHEIVTSVANDETKIALPCKVDTGFDMFFCRCHDDISSVESSSTCIRWIIGGQASIVRFQRPQLSDWVIGPNATSI